MDDVLDSIEKEYYAEVPSREKMIAGAANGMLDTLDDPYARYYTAEEYEEYLAAISGEYYGIGLLVGQPNETGSEVLEVYQGSTSESRERNQRGEYGSGRSKGIDRRKES